MRAVGNSYFDKRSNISAHAGPVYHCLKAILKCKGLTTDSFKFQTLCEEATSHGCNGSKADQRKAGQERSRTGILILYNSYLEFRKCKNYKDNFDHILLLLY